MRVVLSHTEQGLSETEADSLETKLRNHESRPSKKINHITKTHREDENGNTVYDVSFTIYHDDIANGETELTSIASTVSAWAEVSASQADLENIGNFDNV